MTQSLPGLKNVYKLILLLSIFLLIFIFPSCKFTDLIAPEGSTLIVSANPVSISQGGSSTIRVVGYKKNGAILPDKTLIFFSSTIGNIDNSSEIKNGVAIAYFNSDDGKSGEAVITVSSGLAEVSPEEISIIVGNTALEYLLLSASPQTLSPRGGKSDISVYAYDGDMNPLSNIPVILSADYGNLSNNGNVMYSDSSGEVVVILNTSSDTTVTAQSGDVSGTIKVKVEKPPVANFTFSPTDPKIDENIQFDASTSTDSDGIIIQYKWNFGDGRAGSGINASHIYKIAGTYKVVLTVYDNDGNSSSASKDINVSN